MALTTAQATIQERTIEFARRKKNEIARRLTDLSIYPPEDKPVSVFMAGSPGAGKTEASKVLLEEFGESILRIDPDDLRSEFADYSGNNSWLFQAGISILVDKVHDLALKQKQSFLLDDNSRKLYRANIDEIDNHVPEKYTPAALETLLRPS